MLELYILYINISVITSLLFFIIMDNTRTLRIISFLFSIITFAVTSTLIWNTDFSTIMVKPFSFVISNYLKILMTVGLDQCNILFLLLTTILYPIIVLASWTTIKFKFKKFYAYLFLSEYFLINVFLSFDLLFFYIWFEATIIPIFLIIVGWGTRSNRIRAALYLALYTITFSIPFLFSIIYLYSMCGSTNVYFLMYNIVLDIKVQKYLMWFFFIAFGVKLPVFPLHLWLPEAHVEAPTCGSMLLAGILLKLGYYGFLKFFWQFFSLAIIEFNSILLTICTVGCVYTALIALSQSDFKKVIAYSSVSHMNFCLLGIISGEQAGLLGSFLMAIGHGIVSTALFFLVGIIYERTHTRLLIYYSGLNLVIPAISFFMFIFIISNFGFPISLNFVAEFLILLGIGSVSVLLLMFIGIYSVISVAYNLWLYVRMFHGTIKVSVYNSFKFNDLTTIELKTLMPLFVYNIVLCFCPNILIKNIIVFIMAIYYK